MATTRLLELRNTYKWGGGPDKTILLSAEQHDPKHVEVVVVYVRDIRDHEFQITEMAKGRGFTYYEIPESGKFDPRVLKALREIIIRHDINLIHGHDYKSDFFAYLIKLLMWRRPMAIISTAHAWVTLGFRGELYRRLDLFLMKRFDHLLAVSNSTQNEMLSAGLPESKISVIHNGIDIDTWNIKNVQESFREELGIPSEVPVIGYVGRIMPEKDLETWLRAAALVSKSYPETRFVLVGESRDAPMLTQLQRLADSLGIAEKVMFPGYRRKLLPVYASFDIFVLSSLREGLPNSILEAMAMGRPVVTTDVAGAKELVAHGETGFVVPQGSSTELARNMVFLIDHVQIRHQMGQASRTRIEKNFSFSQRLRNVEEIYGRIIASLPSQGGSSN